MERNEIMIGDWLELKSRPVKVNSILLWNTVGFKGISFEDSAASMTSLRGLSITGDILKSNRFVFKPKGTTHPFYSNVIASEDTYLCIVPGYTIILYNSWDLNIAGTGPNSLFIQLHYVHELQHALRLVGLNELADNFKIK